MWNLLDRLTEIRAAIDTHAERMSTPLGIVGGAAAGATWWSNAQGILTSLGGACGAILAIWALASKVWTTFKAWRDEKRKDIEA